MFKIFTSAALCGLLLMPVARAQDDAMPAATDTPDSVNLRAFLSGTELPLSLKMSDLNSSYRSFNVSRANDSFLNYMQMIGAMQGLEFGRY